MVFPTILGELSKGKTWQLNLHAWVLENHHPHDKPSWFLLGDTDARLLWRLFADLLIYMNCCNPIFLINKINFLEVEVEATQKIKRRKTKPAKSVHLIDNTLDLLFSHKVHNLPRNWFLKQVMWIYNPFTFPFNWFSGNRLIINIVKIWWG